MGINYTTDTKISNVVNVKVNEIDDNSDYRCIVNYSLMEFSMVSLMMDLDMSSQSGDTTNPMNIMMRSLVNNNFNQTISSKGNIREISGLDEIILQKMEKISLADEQKEEFKRNFLESFGEKAIRENNLQNSVFYPDSLVGSGDSWFITMTISSYGIPMHLLLDVKLKELTGNHAIFITEGILAARKNNESGNRIEPGISYDLAGTQVSEVKINLQNGIIENSITTQFIHGKVSAPDANSPGNYIEISLKINSRSTLTSRSKK